jgi:hypothetical protein
MKVRRVLWLGVSALAIATWFAAASTSGVRSPVAPVAAPRVTALDRSSAALQSEVARLHERLGPTATPSRSRDLFRFNARALSHRPSPRTAVDAVDVPPPVTPPRPAFKLIGIAEDTSEGGTIRTAIVSGPGDIFLVKPGDTLGGQYHVDQVSAEAVQLTDTVTSASTTLVLR